MLQDSGAPILLTQRPLVGELPAHGARTLVVDELAAELAAESDTSPETDSTPRDLAYVIYTSGSTGRPKGVMVEHAGVPNMSAAQRACFGVTAGTRILQFSSFSFDASVFEMVMALLNGATLVQGTQDELMPGPDLARLLTERGVNLAVLPPSALAHLPHEGFPELRTIIVAGEACPAELVQRWAVGRAFFNAYGPTETTVWATIKRCMPDGSRPSIGLPIQNFTAYVLGDRGRLAPWGAPGELHVGGVGVARGYLNRPELTAERFVADRFRGGASDRMYRTGDLVRWRADGDIDFLGRIDHQVKVRGFRIELGEIEAVIGRFAGVRETIVLVRQDRPAGQGAPDEAPDARVVAYVVADSPATFDTRALREHVAAAVPAYMVPSAFLVLPAFPLTPNGKVDRAALPSPGDVETGRRAYVAPRNATEERLAEIFSQVLRRQVGIHHGFFESGGHSLLAAKALSIVREKFGIAVPVRRLFEKPTIRRVLEAGPPANLVNSYGPAESTVCATWHRITEMAQDAVSVPIGRPIANTQVYVLDDALEPVPPGVPGELCIGGDGLADGYLHRPELTQEKFVAHPFGGPGERIYRTGDLARFRPDGALEFLGRVDFQVKIRGMRVELGETEAALAACPGVRQCAVVAREFAPGDRRLVAYVVAEPDAPVDVSDLRKQLAARLPEHMGPPYFVLLERLPLTPNMKVDRAALPAPSIPRAESSREPSSPVEQRLARIWCEVLEVDRVGAEESFFDLGGHSLLATRVLSRIRREFGVKLTIHQFFEAPTVEALALVVDPEGTWSPTVEEPSIVPTSGMGVVPIAYGQRELWRLSRQYPGLAYNLPVAFRVRGLLNGEALVLCVQEIVFRHEPFRAVLRDVGEGEVLQIIAGLTTVSLHRKNLEPLPEGEREAEAMRLLVQEARRPFELEQGPLARAWLYTAFRPATTCSCSACITWPGTAGRCTSCSRSFGRSTRRLRGQAAGAGAAADPVPRLRGSPAQVGGERGGAGARRLVARASHGGAVGAGASHGSSSDHPRGPDRRFGGAQRDAFIESELMASLGAVAQQQGATLFMTILAAFYAVLAELSGQQDIVVAATTSGRTRRSTEGLIGCCFNKIALRGDRRTGSCSGAYGR